MIPLSLYVHLPWCLRKCPYCDFNSHLREGGLPEDRYIDALFADLERDLPLVWGRPVHSLFLGGGTPSLFSADAIDRLLVGLRARLPISALAEITLEANPGTVDMARFQGFRQAGVKRLSIGVQSFNDACLQRLGRIHDGQQAQTAIDAARQAGFDNFNLDLMFALPEQSIDQALADLDQALSFAPPHLSLYQLTLEPNTAFAQQPPAGLPDADSAAVMEEQLRERLQAAGLHRYEISAHAQSGHAAAHNLNYWQFGDYLGIGAGAHGKLTQASGIIRSSKPRNPEAYMAQALAAGPLGEMLPVASHELPFEFMLNALRLVDGFDPVLFPSRTGLALETIETSLHLAEQQGLITRDTKRIRPSAQGLHFLNDLVSLFLPTQTPSPLKKGD